MNPNERDIVSMTREVWGDHMRYVKALEAHVEVLTGILKQLEAMGDSKEEQRNELD